MAIRSIGAALVVLLLVCGSARAQVVDVGLPTTAIPGAAVAIPGLIGAPGLGGEFVVPGQPVFFPPGSPATTVQLPSFRFFTVSTSVMVPDRGRAVLGGMGSGQSSRISAPGSRATGNAVGAGMMDVGVTIHDMQAMDRALLAMPTGAGSAASADDPWRQRLDQAQGNGAAPLGVAEARQAREAEAAHMQQEAREYLDRGRQAMADDQPGVARILLKMALRRATGDLQREVAATLERLNAPVTAKRSGE